MSIEKQEHRESQEQMQDRFEGFDELSEGGKRAFTDISWELAVKKWDETYTESDIEWAISTRFDTMIAAKTTNLNEAERAELLMVKSEILSVIKGRSGKEAIEAFAALRAKLYGIVAASDGKSGQKDKNLVQVKEGEQVQETAKNDAFDRLKALIEKNETRRLEEIARKKMMSSQLAQIEDRQGEQNEAMASLETLRTLA